VAPAFSQDWSGARTRSVQGIVRDSSGHPVSGAVVELKNLRTLAIRSYLTHQGGKYHFEDLYTNIDYRLQVHRDAAFGPEKLLSRFDSQPQAVVDLEAPDGK
jgi:hypothetical protein